MKLIILSVLFCGALAANYGGYGNGYDHGYGYGGHGYGARGYGGLFQKVVSHYGNTKFAYDDGRSTRQEHIGYDGSRYGSYSVREADGSLRTVNYKAGIDGFQIVGEDGSVKEDNVARAAALKAQADELAKAAPKSPEVPDVPDVPEVPEADLPVAPTNAPDYGKRNQDVYEARKNAYGHKDHGYAGHGYAGYGQGGYGQEAYGYGKGYGHERGVYAAGYGYGGQGYGGYSNGKCYNHENGVWEGCTEKKSYGHGYGYGGYGYGGRHGYGY